jgi:hypothetical protein
MGRPSLAAGVYFPLFDRSSTSEGLDSESGVAEHRPAGHGRERPGIFDELVRPAASLMRRRPNSGVSMSAYLFIAIVIVVIFAVDAAHRWWRHNQWKWRPRDDDDDGPATS